MAEVIITSLNNLSSNNQLSKDAAKLLKFNLGEQVIKELEKRQVTDNGYTAQEAAAMSTSYHATRTLQGELASIENAVARLYPGATVSYGYDDEKNTLTVYLNHPDRQDALETLKVNLVDKNLRSGGKRAKNAQGSVAISDNFGKAEVTTRAVYGMRMMHDRIANERSSLNKAIAGWYGFKGTDKNSVNALKTRIKRETGRIKRQMAERSTQDEGVIGNKTAKYESPDPTRQGFIAGRIDLSPLFEPIEELLSDYAKQNKSFDAKYARLKMHDNAVRGKQNLFEGFSPADQDWLRKEAAKRGKGGAITALTDITQKIVRNAYAQQEGWNTVWATGRPAERRFLEGYDPSRKKTQIVNRAPLVGGGTTRAGTVALFSPKKAKDLRSALSNDKAAKMALDSVALDTEIAAVSTGLASDLTSYEPRHIQADAAYMKKKFDEFYDGQSKSGEKLRKQIVKFIKEEYAGSSGQVDWDSFSTAFGGGAELTEAMRALYDYSVDPNKPRADRYSQQALNDADRILGTFFAISRDAKVSQLIQKHFGYSGFQPLFFETLNNAMDSVPSGYSAGSDLDFLIQLQKEASTGTKVLGREIKDSITNVVPDATLKNIAAEAEVADFSAMKLVDKVSMRNLGSVTTGLSDSILNDLLKTLTEEWQLYASLNDPGSLADEDKVIASIANGILQSTPFGDLYAFDAKSGKFKEDKAKMRKLEEQGGRGDYVRQVWDFFVNSQGTDAQQYQKKWQDSYKSYIKRRQHGQSLANSVDEVLKNSRAFLSTAVSRRANNVRRDQEGNILFDALVFDSPLGVANMWDYTNIPANEKYETLPAINTIRQVLSRVRGADRDVGAMKALIMKEFEPNQAQQAAAREEEKRFESLAVGLTASNNIFKEGASGYAAGLYKGKFDNKKGLITIGIGDNYDVNLLDFDLSDKGLEYEDGRVSDASFKSSILNQTREKILQIIAAQNGGNVPKDLSQYQFYVDPSVDGENFAQRIVGGGNYQYKTRGFYLDFAHLGANGAQGLEEIDKTAEAFLRDLRAAGQLPLAWKQSGWSDDAIANEMKRVQTQTLTKGTQVLAEARNRAYYDQHETYIRNHGALNKNSMWSVAVTPPWLTRDGITIDSQAGANNTRAIKADDDFGVVYANTESVKTLLTNAFKNKDTKKALANFKAFSKEVLGQDLVGSAKSLGRAIDVFIKEIKTSGKDIKTRLSRYPFDTGGVGDMLFTKLRIDDSMGNGLGISPLLQKLLGGDFDGDINKLSLLGIADDGTFDKNGLRQLYSKKGWSALTAQQFNAAALIKGLQQDTSDDSGKLSKEVIDAWGNDFAGAVNESLKDRFKENVGLFSNKFQVWRDFKTSAGFSSGIGGGMAGAWQSLLAEIAQQAISSKKYIEQLKTELGGNLKKISAEEASKKIDAYIEKGMSDASSVYNETTNAALWQNDEEGKKARESWGEKLKTLGVAKDDGRLGERVSGLMMADIYNALIDAYKKQSGGKISAQQMNAKIEKALKDDFGVDINEGVAKFNSEGRMTEWGGATLKLDQLLNILPKLQEFVRDKANVNMWDIMGRYRENHYEYDASSVFGGVFDMFNGAMKKSIVSLDKAAESLTKSLSEFNAENVIIHAAQVAFGSGGGFGGGWGIHPPRSEVNLFEKYSELPQSMGVRTHAKALLGEFGFNYSEPEFNAFVETAIAELTAATEKRVNDKVAEKLQEEQAADPTVKNLTYEELKRIEDAEWGKYRDALRKRIIKEGYDIRDFDYMVAGAMATNMGNMVHTKVQMERLYETNSPEAKTVRDEYYKYYDESQQLLKKYYGSLPRGNNEESKARFEEQNKRFLGLEKLWKGLDDTFSQDPDAKKKRVISIEPNVGLRTQQGVTVRGKSDIFTAGYRAATEDDIKNGKAYGNYELAYIEMKNYALGKKVNAEAVLQAKSYLVAQQQMLKGLVQWRDEFESQGGEGENGAAKIRWEDLTADKINQWLEKPYQLEKSYPQLFALMKNLGYYKAKNADMDRLIDGKWLNSLKEGLDVYGYNVPTVMRHTRGEIWATGKKGEAVKLDLGTIFNDPIIANMIEQGVGSEELTRAINARLREINKSTGIAVDTSGGKQYRSVPGQDRESLREYKDYLAQEYSIKLDLYKLEQQRATALARDDEAQITALDEQITLLKELQDEAERSKKKAGRKIKSEAGRSKREEQKRIAERRYERDTAMFDVDYNTKAQDQAASEYEKLLNKRISLERKVEGAQHNIKLAFSKSEREAQSELLSASQKELNLLDEKIAKLERAGLLRREEQEEISAQYLTQRATMKAEVAARDHGGRSIWDLMAFDIQRAVSRTFDYGIAMRALFTLPQVLRRIYQTTLQLDKALMNLRIVTGDSRSETERLMVTYQKLGKELGATTLQISESANEWLNNVWVTINLSNCWDTLRGV